MVEGTQRITERPFPLRSHAVEGSDGFRPPLGIVAVVIGRELAHRLSGVFQDVDDAQKRTDEPPELSGSFHV